MMDASAAWMLAAILTGVAGPAEEPEPWTRWTEAAEAALVAGDYAKAEGLLVQVIREAEKLGDNDLRQAVPLERLAAFYRTDEVRRPADAEPLLRRALTIRERSQGPDDPDVAETLLQLASCRLAPLWTQCEDLSAQCAARMADHNGVYAYFQGSGGLSEVLDVYAKLLRRTNRAVPLPTEADLAYLKKIEAVYASALVDDLCGTRERMSLSPLHDDGLSHIGRLYGLTRLDVARQSVTDSGLAHLAQLEHLERLDLSGNPVTDAGLVHLEGLTRLRTLNLAQTQVTDAGLDRLQELANLRELDVRSTLASRAAIDRLCRARPELQVRSAP